MALAKNSNRAKQTQYLKMILICYCLLFLITGMYFYVGNELIISQQVLKLWDTTILANSTHPYHLHILTTAPLTFHNFNEVFRLFLGQLSPSSSFHLSLIFFICTCWLYLQRLAKQNIQINLLRIVLFFLLLLTPFSMSLLVLTPVDTLNIILLSAIIFGIEEINVGIESRGVLIAAISLLFLFLNGEVGIALTGSIFLILPILLRSSVFSINSMSGYIITFFPLISAMLSVAYLSVIYNKDMEYFLSMANIRHSFFAPLQNWIYLAPMLILPFIKKRKEDLKIKLSKAKTFLIPFIANVIFIVLAIDHSQNTLFGIAIIGFAFEILQKKSLHLRHAVFTAILIISANYSSKAFIPNDIVVMQATSQYTKEDIELINFLKVNTDVKTMYYTSNYSKIRLTHKTHYGQLFPNTDSFNRHHFESGNTIDRIVVENSSEQIHPQFFSQKQTQYFHHGLPGMSVVFHNQNWKVLQTGNPVALKQQTKQFKHDFEQLFAREFLFSVSIIVLFMLYRMNFLHVLTQRLAKKV